MGRHKKKKVTEKEAEDTLTQQLVESGKKEQLKILVRGGWKKEGKNPAYGRQSISRPMRIVAPIPQ